MCRGFHARTVVTVHYIGETARYYGKRQEEHREEVESIINRTFTLADRKSRASVMNKSAITDCSERQSCKNWSGAKILEREGTLENHAGQGVDLDQERTKLHGQR